MADYTKLIDAETWDFIRQTENWYPPDTIDQGIEENRRRYDAMCRAFFTDYPTGVSAQDISTFGVPLRIYRRKNEESGATVLFCHGGSLMLGGLDSHDDVCAEICNATGYRVIAVDYRLNPEFSRQDALHDVQRALDWIRQNRGGKTIGVGDSAGGFLVAKTINANQSVGDIIGQVLIYPGLYSNTGGGSLDEHAYAPLLTKAEVLAFRESVNSENLSGLSGDCLSLRDDDLSGSPVTVTLSAECDPIADDAKYYAEAIKNAGGTAFWFEDKGLVHGHLRARHSVKRARESFERVLRTISLMGSGVSVTRAGIEN